MRAIIADEVDAYRSIVMDQTELSDKTSWIRHRAGELELSVEGKGDALARISIERFRVLGRTDKSGGTGMVSDWPFDGKMIYVSEDGGQCDEALIFEAMSPLMIGDVVERVRDGARCRITGERIPWLRCVIGQKSYAAMPVKQCDEQGGDGDAV